MGRRMMSVWAKEHPFGAELAVYPSRQRYTFVRREPQARVVRFESLGGSFVADIRFDDQGVVLEYPGIARLAT